MQTLKDEDIFKFSSKVKGPKVCILGGVHGNEVGGVNAIKEILENDFKILKGEVTFVFANRKAIDQNVRFVEENLNRCFIDNKEKTGSYEEKLSLDLKEILNGCDICLDLHASSVKGTEEFIICEKNAYEYIKEFPIKKVCGGFDKLQPGGTDSYVNRLGKVGICVECGYLTGENSKAIAKNCIYSLLKKLRIVEFENKESEKEFLEVRDIYFIEENFGLLRSCQNFEFLKKGTLIGKDGDKEVYAKYDGFILFAHNKKKTDVDKEAFLYGVRI